MILRVLTYRRYANITVWYFSQVPRRYAELLLSACSLLAAPHDLSKPKVFKTVPQLVYV